MKTPKIVFSADPSDVNWADLKAALKTDRFDNGRSAKELRESFLNSRHICLALVAGRVIGTARLLSDGVCNAYLVDVWVRSEFRRRGIAERMIKLLLNAVPGQHVYLQTDDRRLYGRIGFRVQPDGMSIVAGPGLRRSE